MTGTPFDFDAVRKRIERVLKKQIFFIGGPFKSGTTWLQLMLNAHPQIACRGEGHFTNRMMPAFNDAYGQYANLIQRKNQAIFSELDGYPSPTPDHLLYIWSTAVLLMLSEYGDIDTIRLIGEKTPDNVRAMPMLHSAFPKAKFINIVRDGRDVAVSAWFHNLRVSRDWALKTFGTLERFCDQYATQWQQEVEAGRAFAADNPGCVLEMSYEKLHADTRNEMIRVLDFLGAETSEPSLEVSLNAGRFERVAQGRANGTEDRNSHFRLGIVGDWRNHLDQTAAARFAEKAQGWLAKMGYS